MSRPDLLTYPERKFVLAGRGLGFGSIIGTEILELTGVEKPHVLVIASPASTEENHKKYTDGATATFIALGASVTSLHKFNEDPTPTQIQHEIGNASAIWVTGGNTSKALKAFADTGVGDALKNAPEKVISGGSAGALIQAHTGFSWLTPVGKPQENRFVTTQGLGFVNATISVHNDRVEAKDGLTEPRGSYFRPFLRIDPSLPQPGIGIDDAAALVFDGNLFRVLAAEGNESSGVTAYVHLESGLAEIRHLPQSHYSRLTEFAA